MKAKLPKQEKSKLYGYQVAGAAGKGDTTVDPTNTTYITTTRLGKR